MIQYRIAYDAASDGLWFWPVYLLLAIFPLVGCVGCVMLYRHMRSTRLLTQPSGVARFAVLAVGLLAATSFFSVMAGYDSYATYRHFADGLAAGRGEIVEGIVEDFVPQRPDGHPAERFRVGGHHYEYSAYQLQPAYHLVRGSGGIISAGLRVRILDVDDYIARVEIAQS